MNVKHFPICLLLSVSLFGKEPAKEAAFSHHLHVAVEELECADCHKGTMRSKSLSEVKPVQLKDCWECHDAEELDDPIGFHLADSSFRIINRSHNVRFSHDAHAERKISCAECHGTVLEEGRVLSESPNMRSCMECHIQKADISCLSCHFEEERPADHLASYWLMREGHATEAKFRPEDCEMCHTKEVSCMECHQGGDYRKVHELNYRFTHGIDVKFNTSDCSVCHQPLELFCGDCHEGVQR